MSAPGVKDRTACSDHVRVCEEEASQLLRKRGNDRLRQVNFIISCYTFFTKSKIMFLCFLYILKARDIGEHHSFEIDVSYY